MVRPGQSDRTQRAEKGRKSTLEPNRKLTITFAPQQREREKVILYAGGVQCDCRKVCAAEKMAEGQIP